MDDAVSTSVPEIFGPYRVEESLGRGGMGEVHRAYDTVNDRQVALKRLANVAGEEFRARFRREARIVAELREPHVVPIHAHGEIDGQLYLDMKLIEGPDLTRLLADGPLDPVRANEILTHVAAALDAAHARGVLHRDVKPGNILLDPDGTAYLCDFGIARSFAPDVTKLTETGDYIGTLDYMAPERLVRGDVDAASDVYSLACVLFQCLTGRVPFPASDEVGKLAAQLNDPPPAPSLFDRRIPPAMDLVVRTGMDKDPRRRYPTAGELMAAARAATATQAPQAPVVDPPTGGDPGQIFFVRLLATVSTPLPTGSASAGPGTPGEAATVAFGERCPYPGLQSFGTGDSDWFFGREQAVRDLLARLARQRADSGPLVVVGASGMGKSSLLHAGLLATHARMAPSAPRLALTPGERPIATLAARMAALVHADANQLAWQLYHHPTTFGEMCRVAVAASDAPLLIAIDQAEELFTQCFDVREREAFATALANAWPARVALAVRADFVEHSIGLAPLKAALGAPYLLGPLTAAELAEVVTRPAEAAGLVLEPGLVDRLITDVGAGHDSGALPRLAHALRETWHHRSGNVLTLRGYQGTGGVDRAVALTADGVHSRLGEFDQRALRTALLRMITLLDGGGIARRRAHRAELPPRVLESLIAARLVTVDADFVAFSHDALLTAWPRLRQWVEEDRQGLLTRQELREAAATWRAGGQDRGDLYRGARLVAALDWSATRPADITPEEWAFLKASERERKRQTRRLRTMVASLATLLVIALVAGTLTVLAREDAERESDIAVSRQLAAQSLAEAHVDPVNSARTAIRSWRTSPTAEARGALLSAAMLTYPAAFSTGVDGVYAADINHDGTLVAVGSRRGAVVVWDVEARKPLDIDVGGEGGILAVKFSPDGTMLAVSDIGQDDPDSGVRIWAVPEGAEVSRPRAQVPAIGPVAWRPDGKAIAAASVRAEGGVWIGEWDPATGELIRWVVDGAQDTSGIVYDTAGDRLAVGHSDGSVELWEPATGRRISDSPAHRDSAAYEFVPVQLAMSEELLASSSVSDNMIRFWNPRTGAPVREMPDLTRHVTDAGQGPSSMTFSQDGTILYTNSDANTMTLWDPRSAALVGTLPDGPRAGSVAGGTVTAVATSADGRTRMAARSDGTVMRWFTNTNWMNEPAAAVTGLAFDPDGDVLVAGDADGALYTWRTRTGELLGAPSRPGGSLFGVQVAPDGTRITGTRDATFTLTPPDHRDAPPRTVTLAGRTFRGAMAVSPDGHWLAAAHQPDDATTAQEDNRINVWNAEDLTKHTELRLAEQWPVQLTFSPDGTTLLALTGDQRSEVPESGEEDETAANMVTWRMPSLTDRQQFPLGSDTLTTAEYTPDGRTLVTGGTGGMIALRDAATGELREEFGRHPSAVRDIAMSPDGHTIASVTVDDPLVRLWDVETHEIRAILDGHSAPLNGIEFSPDGEHLATAGIDTEVGIWVLAPERAMTRICDSLRHTDIDDIDELC